MGLLDWFKKSIGGGEAQARSADSQMQARSADSRAEARNADMVTMTSHADAPAEPPIGTVEVGSAARSAGSTVANGSADDILCALKAKVAELSNGQLGEEDLDADAMLFDFGYVDSLSAVTLISFIDSRYGVTVSELDLVGAINNLQLLAEHIQTQRRG